jgi:hypothetical protein
MNEPILTVAAERTSQLLPNHRFLFGQLDPLVFFCEVAAIKIGDKPVQFSPALWSKKQP